MKVGDLIKVQYVDEDEWYTGFVVEIQTPEDTVSVHKMYCTERQAYHILNPEKDNIRILSEG